MDEIFVVSGTLRHNTQQNTNLHHYCVELFYTVIDFQLQELNNHISKTNILALDPQLQSYIFDMRINDSFLELQGVGELTENLVKIEKHDTYPLVYLFVKLVLIIPIATAIVERSFSAIKYIKNELHNRIGD